MERLTATSLLVLSVSAVLSVTGSRARAEVLTEARAAELALGASPSLRASLLDFGASEQVVRAAEAERRPVFRASVGGGRSEGFGATAAGVAPSSDESFTASAEVATLAEQLETVRLRLPLVEDTVAIARELAEAERERLELGTATTTELLDAQETERATELRRLRVLVDGRAAALSATHRTGELLERYAGLLGNP